MEANTCKRGLGLCLSGGGFRASFYHIGVLARMAELGMLKHVEVISTVSGGSIVGAAYYLLLKQLLESKFDKATQSSEEVLDDSDYITLIEQLETHFLQAAQKNLRMRTFANPYKNVRMSLPNYSRSDAIGELYEQYIYRPLIKIDDRPIMMSDLLITPRGVKPGEFNPNDAKDGNAMRTHKVPILLLNATSLNTGHNWCFSATWMGEVPPRNLNMRDIDKKDRYRRVYYKDITSREKDFPLGKAVAASAAVPGLLPPMAVSNLYLNRRVQLVDGGVFDNQGITGLLDPDNLCSDFIVSDASGQRDAVDKPDTREYNVLANASFILMGRVREEIVNYVEETRSEHIAYFHLTRGLFARDIEYNNLPIKNLPGAKMKAGIDSSECDFDVHEDMQRALAHVRTDLDSFTEIEAGCLQADGYQMSGPRLMQLPKKYRSTAEMKSNEWGFIPYIAKLAENDGMVRKHLEVSSSRFFKPLRHLFNGALGIFQSLVLLLISVPSVALLVLILYVINWGLKQLMSYGVWQIISDPQIFQQFLFDAAPFLYGLLIAFVISMLADKLIKGSGKWVVRIRNLIKSPMALITGALTRVLLPAVFALPIMLYLYTIDWFFVNKIGKLK